MLFFLRGVIGGFFKIEGSMCVGGCMCECVGGDLGEDGCTVNLEGSVEEKQDWSQGRGLLSTPDNPPFVRCPESQQRFVSKIHPSSALLQKTSMESLVEPLAMCTSCTKH